MPTPPNKPKLNPNSNHKTKTRTPALRRSGAASPKSKLPAAVAFEVIALNPLAHTFKVKCSVAHPSENQIIDFPQWIAGSYMIRDFSKHLHSLSASQNEHAVQITQLTKSSWQVHCTSQYPLHLEYEIYAKDSSVRGAWLDQERAFFNGTSLFFEVKGFASKVHHLTLSEHLIAQITAQATPSPEHRQASRSPRPQVYTTLTPLKLTSSGWGTYQAFTFEDLVDTPVLIGTPWVGEFSVRGVRHRFALTGHTPSFNAERLLRDTKKICETVLDFWHPTSRPVIRDYLFILHATADGYGGLEHKHSTVLQCKRSDLPSVSALQNMDGYTGLLGLISHEYFHTWNVKRLRPAEFASYAFDRENYTELLWFFEGFTSYYDDLLLKRSGLITQQQYLKLLNKSIQQVLQTPGRHIQTVAQASMDAWIKYYKPDENSPNTTVSYYAKGALVALCFDLKLRKYGSSLDAVMLELFSSCAGGPMKEQDFEQALRKLTQRSWKKEIAEWVHSVRELPVESLLKDHGVQVIKAPNPLQLQLGIRAEDQKSGVFIKVVLANTPAQRSGLMSGDELLAVETADVPSGEEPKGPKQTATPSTWRLSKLEDLALYVARSKSFVLLIAREQRIRRVRVNFDVHAAQSDRSNCTLSIKDEALVQAWLK
jgi:predicted metalloprotease with PDZ domain